MGVTQGLRAATRHAIDCSTDLDNELPEVIGGGRSSRRWPSGALADSIAATILGASARDATDKLAGHGQQQQMYLTSTTSGEEQNGRRTSNDSWEVEARFLRVVDWGSEMLWIPKLRQDEYREGLVVGRATCDGRLERYRRREQPSESLIASAGSCRCL